MQSVEAELEHVGNVFGTDQARKGWKLWPVVTLLAVASVVLGFVQLPFALAGVGRWLLIEDPVQPARAIVVFGGHVPFRAMEAAAVYHRGMAPEIWLTRSAIHQEDVALQSLGIRAIEESEYSRQVLERLGVPAASIRLLDQRVENTAEEVGVVAQELRRVGGNRVILMTSKNHTRRVHVIWGKLVGDHPQAIVRYTPDDPYDPNGWWRHSRDSLGVTREVCGLLNAWLGFPMPSN